jgi:hypothetical protein
MLMNFSNHILMEGERDALPEWYARCCCEENIYRLIQRDQSITHAVFISLIACSLRNAVVDPEERDVHKFETLSGG